MISSETKVFLQQAISTQRTKNASGAVFLGVDSGAWPAWWHDVVDTIELNRALAEDAIDKVRFSNT